MTPHTHLINKHESYCWQSVPTLMLRTHRTRNEYLKYRIDPHTRP